jgi:hypothetical protein
MYLGTSASPVIFTTTDDDNYGNPADAGQDGQTQQNGIATFLNFSDISNDSSTIKNAIFKGMDKAVNMYSASPTFDSCSFLRTNHSFYLTGVSQPIINHSIFIDNNWPISTSVLSYPASTVGNVVSGNTKRVFILLMKPYLKMLHLLSGHLQEFQTYHMYLMALVLELVQH